MENLLEQASGKIRLRLEDGSYKDFSNNQEALEWLTTNKYHITEQVKPKEVELPKLDISVPTPHVGINYLQGTVPYVHTPNDYSALLGKSRLKGVLKTLKRNPNALDDYNIFNNVMDFYRIGSGGFLNRLSPTQNLRLVYDAVTGENVIDSMLGNHGVVSDNMANKYPWASLALNTVIDGGIGYSTAKTTNYLNGYKQIGQGASSKVFVSNNPLKRKYVYKVSNITPDEMLEINNLPGTLPSKHISKWTKGTHVYKQERITPTSKPDLKKFSRTAQMQGFFLKLFPGDTEVVYHNPRTNQVMLDLNGNWGIDKYGRTVSFDPAVLKLQDYLGMLKKGGKFKK